MYNIDYSIAHARAHGTYFYEIKFLRLKENSYNSQKFCTLKITWCTVYKWVKIGMAKLSIFILKSYCIQDEMLATRFLFGDFFQKCNLRIL